MRPIDADALIQELESDPFLPIHVKSALLPFIKMAPTIDPESLRPQGEWEDEYGGKYANPRYRCSVCKEKALYKMKLDHLGIWHEVQALTPSCPYCGAKMRKEADLV